MNEYEPFLTHSVKDAIMQHMLDDSPNEACGLITFTSGEYKYVRQTNISDTPTEHFQFSKDVSALLVSHDSVVAFVHSHPHGDAMPTKMDMQIQKDVGKPSVICSLDQTSGIVEVFSFGNHLLDYPLIGREFRYGVFDCLEAIRSWRWQKEGALMDQFPRAYAWWFQDYAKDLDAEDLDLYMRHHESQGYRKFDVDLSDPASQFHPMVGDLVFMRMGGDMNVCNHAAIYVGNNLIYHHRQNHKSTETPIGYCLGNGMIIGWARQQDKLQ